MGLGVFPPFQRYRNRARNIAACLPARLLRRGIAGTYNNMWMVLDLANFKPGKALPAEFLVVLEEIPTMIRR